MYNNQQFRLRRAGVIFFIYLPELALIKVTGGHFESSTLGKVPPQSLRQLSVKNEHQRKCSES